MQLPTVVLACKSDMEQQVDPLHALEVIQHELHSLLDDAVAYDNVICGCKTRGGKDHKPYLHIYCLRIILEGPEDLKALTPKAIKALPLMTDLREIQFVIRDSKPSMRFLLTVGEWFTESNTADQISKLRLDDQRRVSSFPLKSRYKRADCFYRRLLVLVSSQIPLPGPTSCPS